LKTVKRNLISVAKNLQVSFGLTVVNEVMGIRVLILVWVGV